MKQNGFQALYVMCRSKSVSTPAKSEHVILTISDLTESDRMTYSICVELAFIGLDKSGYQVVF